MKKEYISPEVEVFQFEVADRVMDSGCPSYTAPKCSTDYSCKLYGICYADTATSSMA